MIMANNFKFYTFADDCYRGSSSYGFTDTCVASRIGQEFFLKEKRCYYK